MRCFGLTPDQTHADTTVGEVKPRSLATSMIVGCLSFGAVSALAYSIWAFPWIIGLPAFPRPARTAIMYTSIALVYIGLGGLALSRLVAVAGAWRRFPFLFATAFVTYAILWSACWFGLKGKYQADLFGAAFGLAAMTWIFHQAFGQPRGFVRSFAALLLCHSLGYYAGGKLYAEVGGPTGRLLWGAAHGLGFGTGLGCVLFYCQQALTSKAGRA